MKNLLSNKKTPILAGVLGFLAVVLIGVMIVSNTTTAPSPELNNKDKITVTDPKTGKQFTFSKDGLVTYYDANGNLISEIWDQDKINAFFDYVNQYFVAGGEGKYQVDWGGQSGSVGDDGDELIDQSTGGGDTGGGGGISDLFATPTPPSGGGSSGGEDDNNNSTPPPQAPSWCKHWRLSYCADPIVVTTPTPSPSYPPGVVTAKDCAEWAAKSGYRTVISQGSCYVFAESTPTP